MPLTLKRPAAATVAKASEEPKAKRVSVGRPKKLEDPLIAKCDAVISLLGTAEGCSPTTLEMLAAAAKGCLLVPKEERHPVQTSVVEMIGEVLSSVETHLADNIATLRGKISEADAEKARRETAIEAAVAAKSEKCDAEANAINALDESEKATEAASEELNAANSEQKVGNSDLSKADKKKAAAEAIMQNDLSGLKDGTASDVSESLKAIAKVGKELGLEEQLINSASVALGKAPSERGGFDGMVVQQVDENFSGAIVKLAEQLANGEASKAARAAKVEACGEKLNSAIEHGEACKGQLKAAKLAVKEADKAQTAAQKSLEDFGPEMDEVAARADAADAELCACKADLATFQELVEGLAPAPETAPADEADTADAEATMQEEAA